MRKILLFLIPLLFVIAGIIFVVFFLNKKAEKGALQVTSTPQSDVYLNGKIIGVTPLCKCEAKDMLPTGEYTIRLAPKEGSFPLFEEKVQVGVNVLTVVDRTFGPPGASEGSIISLAPLGDAKRLELFVSSFPVGSRVFVDTIEAGTAPLLLKNLTESDHEVKLTKDGYHDKTVRIRTVAGYKVTLVTFLSVGEKIAPTPTIAISPTPSPTSVTILDTPTGFLRVRESASLQSAEVGRVIPGQEYTLISELTGWYEIRVDSTTIGWVSTQYAEKK